MVCLTSLGMRHTYNVSFAKWTILQLTLCRIRAGPEPNLGCGKTQTRKFVSIPHLLDWNRTLNSPSIKQGFVFIFDEVFVLALVSTKGWGSGGQNIFTCCPFRASVTTRDNRTRDLLLVIASPQTSGSIQMSRNRAFIAAGRSEAKVGPVSGPRCNRMVVDV